MIARHAEVFAEVFPDVSPDTSPEVSVSQVANPSPRSAAQPLAARRGFSCTLLFFNQLGGAFGTTGLLELRHPLRAVLIHSVVLELLLVSARPDHHRPGHDPA